MRKKHLSLLLLFLFVIVACRIQAQRSALKKYPSLFWEITGNGMKKPSYLFGTMHVSSKMVFHLSDSFYYAMKNVDAVALELNPDLWQGQMVRLDKLKQNYVDFVQAPGGDYLNESSFRTEKFDAALKSALSTEPTVVNSLLYRSYKSREDFEEDTFLDLYIFQTGKKLGKRSAGVEDYYETEKVVLEAYADMAKEKKKKTFDIENESIRDINEKIQEAYRSGDLDLMDSLDLLTERSDAFREKFLYKRNEIQAGSIDTILKRNSLFVGVGAAHLAGPRGIIELLRKMGYTLRPIKMADRDAARKEETDKLKVPVTFSTIHSEDDFYSVNTPGPLYEMKDDYQLLNRRQYSDMSNGSYYLVTRVKTYGAFYGESETQVLKKVDSLLYENIPGRILKKTQIEKNGYKGYDISNRTRRGDLQHYQIFVTPFEVLIFKMSGKDNYVEGTEAQQFFSSIQLKSNLAAAKNFTPTQGGFSVRFPHTPHQTLNNTGSDGNPRWEYEAIDKTTGDAYLLMKKSINNYKFLEEDSFDLKLMETSFNDPDVFDHQLIRKPITWMGYAGLDVKEKLKDSSVVSARFLVKGADYYVLSVHSKDTAKNFDGFFNSFKFETNRYHGSNQYVDTFLHFTVNSPVVPELDQAYRAKLENVSAEVANSNVYGNNNYWPKSKTALFKSDSTGEAVLVSIQQYPKYYYTRDSARFWRNEMNDYLNEGDLFIYKKDSFSLANNERGYRFSLRDTGSSREIERMIILKNKYMYSLVSLSDTLTGESPFTKQFFSSFAPEASNSTASIFKSNIDSFFIDLFSKDSATHAKAQKTISNLYYGEQAVPQIMDAIARLPHDKDYMDSKTKLIAELGYIADTSKKEVVKNLKAIYEQVADTSIFQNEVIKALARHKTKEATKLLKTLLLNDPPFYDNSYEYSGIFMNIEDSLELARQLYPDLLELAAVQDYKEPVTSLLTTLVDSGYIKASQYKSYFKKLYFDATIELKKQKGKEEKIISNDKNDDNDEVTMVYRNTETNNDLNDYAVVLSPFYETKKQVQVFFDKLLRSTDDDVRYHAALCMLRRKLPIEDSLFEWFAASDQWRGRLFQDLDELDRLDRFPEKYRSQQLLAKSYLVADKNYDKIDSIAYLSKTLVNDKGSNGWVYFFKYRIKKTDDWKIGLSGFQPEDTTALSTNDKITVMTDKKIKDDKPLDVQLNDQLQKALFQLRKSSKNFYEFNGAYRFTKAGDYQE